MAEPGGAFSAYSAMTDKGNVDRGLRIAEFGAALAEPVAATVPLPLRFRIGRRTLMELLVPTRPQAAVAISSQYLKRESQGFVPGSRTCPTKPAFGRTIANRLAKSAAAPLRRSGLSHSLGSQTDSQ
jgi:hypothetical protein